MATNDLGPERRERILQAVRDRGTVRVSDLAEEFDVSAMTVRRDIGALAEEGRLERIHGGARLRGGHVAEEPLPEAKTLLNPVAKSAIARAAAARISPGEVVGIGSGTTALAFARQIVKVRDLTVATNCVPVAQVLWESSSAKVVLTGGDRTPSEGLAGPIALQALEHLHLDTVVLGTHGLDIEAGCTTPNLLEAQVNRAFLQRARRSMILADAEKWGVVGLTTFASISDMDVLVTDPALPASACEALEAEGVEVVVAD
ncbi:MAG: DeoR/GlpR family DNA-binding transcription regulator [Galactobacter sp.]|uniref:DeoR/GlpR family DNA-binding transcription regulator n=1 Tax=Galactobacter sp. TaxID=2676125 RepID=UPI0025C37012|nr:DeoR/GlpR family DNA-binding transcription regulator [Galactobacter sp.]